MWCDWNICQTVSEVTFFFFKKKKGFLGIIRKYSSQLSVPMTGCFILHKVTARAGESTPE